jgi:hypothetical protein
MPDPCRNAAAIHAKAASSWMTSYVTWSQQKRRQRMEPFN